VILLSRASVAGRFRYTPSVAGDRQSSTASDGREPWYGEGLRFECQPDCGACCTNHDDYGFVYLETEDVDRLAALLRLPREEFLTEFTELDDGFIILRMDQPDCPFLDGTRCGVYGARPTQCRTFPFWEENLATRARWERISRFCPGIQRGGVHSLPVIRSHLAARDGD
jgi:Fe-S-cluster containining protein